MELHDLPGDGYVSTGRLPPPDHVRQLVDEAHARFGSVTQGEVSGVYPALATNFRNRSLASVSYTHLTLPTKA